MNPIFVTCIIGFYWILCSKKSIYDCDYMQESWDKAVRNYYLKRI